MACEWAKDKIRANAVAPWVINTKKIQTGVFVTKAIGFKWVHFRNWITSSISIFFKSFFFLYIMNLWLGNNYTFSFKKACALLRSRPLPDKCDLKTPPKAQRNQFQSYVEKTLSHKIKCVQSDWGGEYRSLSKILQQKGITHHLSCPHTHQQNG